MNHKKPVIAIDGYSSTGKSSISKEIAKRLGIIHLDSGSLYRAVTVYALNHFLQNNEIDLKALSEHLADIHLEIRNIDGNLSLFLNNKNIDTEIRNPRISDYVSDVAKQAFVREFLLSFQRNMAKNGGIIMDGRDIGTVVLPDADYKFFLTASPDERARRRWEELKTKNIFLSIEEVKKNLLMRDKTDSERLIAPLKQAKDAILIDNTNINKEETIALILSYIN